MYLLWSCNQGVTPFSFPALGYTTWWAFPEDRHELDCESHVGHGTVFTDVGELLINLHVTDLGVTKSHSRPHVSNDNPHIESLFKAVKYQPTFPATFLNIYEAREFCRTFFHWYNNEHRHSGIALLTPADVHHGRADDRLQQRQRVLDAAYAAHPERFVRGRPRPPQLAPASYINRPADALTQPLKHAA